MTFLGSVVRWFLNPAHWHGDFGIPNRIEEHVLMSLAATGAAALVALPVGLTLGHFGRGGAIAINISNVGRALPSFAILVLAVQLVGIGATPAKTCT
jgi:osmoprotectant transport system permease protein